VRAILGVAEGNAWPRHGRWQAKAPAPHDPRYNKDRNQLFPKAARELVEILSADSQLSIAQQPA
jgi:hypothetical protein